MNTKVQEILSIENLKCGGCANTVTKAVEKVDGATEAKVNLEDGSVVYSVHSNQAEQVRTLVIEALAKAGYPLDGEGNAWQKAKSFIGCAKGRLSN